MNSWKWCIPRKNRHLTRNFEKKIVGPFFLRQKLTPLAIKKLIKVLSWIWMRKTNFVGYNTREQLAYCRSHHGLFEGVFLHPNLLKKPMVSLQSWFITVYFFLWGYVKDKVFTHNLTSVEELKIKIMKVIHSIAWCSDAAKSIPEPAEASSSMLGSVGEEAISNISCNLLFYLYFILFFVFCNIVFSINSLAFSWDTLLFPHTRTWAGVGQFSRSTDAIPLLPNIK